MSDTATSIAVLDRTLTTMAAKAEAAVLEGGRLMQELETLTRAQRKVLPITTQLRMAHFHLDIEQFTEEATTVASLLRQALDTLAHNQQGA